jgi:hypothetical protein
LGPDIKNMTPAAFASNPQSLIPSPHRSSFIIHPSLSACRLGAEDQPGDSIDPGSFDVVRHVLPVGQVAERESA